MTASQSPIDGRGVTPGLVLALGAGVLGIGACANAEPELPTALDAVVFDTLFVIGAASGEPWEAFEGLWDIEADADGRLAVLDLGGPAIHIFDAKGEHVGSITETGLESGQLDGPLAIAWSEPGDLLVWDPGSSWVSQFSVGGSSVQFVDRWRAFAFGETGFCASGGRTYLSYWQDGTVVHEIGKGGITQSFAPAPLVAGAETLGPDLLEIALEELTPSALLCTAAGVVDVGFVQSIVRLHDPNGTPLWSKEFSDLRPIVAYSDDGVGLGRAFDPEGSHLLRSVVPWGRGMILVQHELRTSEFAEDAGFERFESRLLDLADGSEVDRSESFPLALTAQGRRLYLAQDDPFPTVTVVKIR